MDIVFDFDSTLADSHKLVIEAVREIVSRETKTEYTSEYINQKFIANSEDLYPQFGIDMKDAETRDRLEDHWREIARENWVDITFFEGIKELLTSLKKEGYGVHILTLRDRESTEKVLKQHELYELFDKIGCGDDKVQKPNPEALWNLLGEAKKSQSKSIFMVGDSPVDVALALKAGVRSIHAKWCSFARTVQLNGLEPCFEATSPLDCLSIIADHHANR